VYLILELLRGPELLTRIRQAKHFTEQEAARIFRKIVDAVRFVHKKGAVHRDLKPEVCHANKAAITTL
jgi:serine/threonine protein kinase